MSILLIRHEVVKSYRYFYFLSLLSQFGWQNATGMNYARLIIWWCLIWNIFIFQSHRIYILPYVRLCNLKNFHFLLFKFIRFPLLCFYLIRNLTRNIEVCTFLCIWFNSSFLLFIGKLLIVQICFVSLSCNLSNLTIDFSQFFWKFLFYETILRLLNWSTIIKRIIFLTLDSLRNWRISTLSDSCLKSVRFVSCLWLNSLILIIQECFWIDINGI